MIRLVAALVALALLGAAGRAQETLRGTGDLGIVVERAAGAILVVDTTRRTQIARVEGLGDLSHASAVFSPDGRYAYVFGRDGGLTKVDILAGRIERRILQAGNAIGGAISDDGTLIAVSNYEPGGVRVFDAATLEPVADIPAEWGDGALSKTIGLVDVPGRRFVFGLWDAGEIWIADFAAGDEPVVTKIRDVGSFPYDGVVTANGRHYIAGLFGEDALAHVDLWAEPPRAERVLAGYRRGAAKLPVYKMPHLQGWALTDGVFMLPAVGRNEVLVVDADSFAEIDRVTLVGQPVFVVARPDQRQVWVNFAPPDNDTVQVIDVPSRRVVKTLKPGPAVLHIEFTPRGGDAWLSVRDADAVKVYDARSFAEKATLPVRKPSGIFFAARAHRTGL